MSSARGSRPSSNFEARAAASRRPWRERCSGTCPRSSTPWRTVASSRSSRRGFECACFRLARARATSRPRLTRRSSRDRTLGRRKSLVQIQSPRYQFTGSPELVEGSPRPLSEFQGDTGVTPSLWFTLRTTSSTACLGGRLAERGILAGNSSPHRGRDHATVAACVHGALPCVHPPSHARQHR